MATFNIEFFSSSLIRPVSFEMFIPNDNRTFPGIPHNPNYDRKAKTVFVLHGYTGWGKGWDAVREVANRLNFALVFPSAENSFYLDSAVSTAKFGTFVGVELVEYIRKTFGLCMTKDETFVSGLSMGGFGALHVALSHPDTFGKSVALSSALIVHQIANMQPGDSNPVANYEYYTHCFGDLSRVAESDSNPETLVRKLQTAGRALPELYMACGTEDFLLEPNRQFRDFLVANNVPVSYHESAGQHDMVFWNEYFAKGFDWLNS